MTSRIPLFVLLAALTAWGCTPDGASDKSGESGTTADAAADASSAEEIEITPGLTMRRLNNGYGRAAVAGDLASVHYTGWLYDPNAPDGRGKKFDSSVDRGQQFQFPLGAGRVIRGWDEGVAGMLIGEKRELKIAPELGYGSRGAGSAIPPGATLLFEVELLGLRGPNDE
jgi:FKBP-type peptidyl-prolyl cis-trans isomerase FkpA